MTTKEKIERLHLNADENFIFVSSQNLKYCLNIWLIAKDLKLPHSNLIDINVISPKEVKDYYSISIHSKLYDSLENIEDPVGLDELLAIGVKILEINGINGIK